MKGLTKIITTGIIAGLVLFSTNCLSTNKPNSNIPDRIWRDQDPYWRNPIIPHKNGNYNYSPSKVILKNY
ncbi:hypothetical protein M0R19_00600 [Candidatus Pacearchaeota archaeon]|jgi:hypothetical protein|nr:hypothetical protein [Candidatus Pacearchaeota archaeon]